MSNTRMLNDLLRIQLAYHSQSARTDYQIDSNDNGYFLMVTNSDDLEIIRRYGDYPVRIGTTFEEAREWILQEFNAYA